MHLFLLGASHHSAPVDLRERIDFARRGDSGGAGGDCRRHAPLRGRGSLDLQPRRDLLACRGSLAGRRHAGGVHERVPRRAGTGVGPPLVSPPGSRRRPAPVPGGRRARFAGRGRAADPGTGQGTRTRSPRSADSPGRRSTGCFNTSFTVGKRVRSETGLGEGAVSVSYAAISLARKIFGDLAGRRGAGGRRRRDGRAHRHPPALPERRPHRRRQPQRRPGRDPSPPRSTAWRCRGGRSPPRLTTTDIVLTATGAPRWLLTRGAGGRRDAAAPRPAAVHDRHRPAPRRRTVGQRRRAGLPLQHRRPAVDRPREPRAASGTSGPGGADGARRRSTASCAGSAPGAPYPPWWALRRHFERTRQQELERLAPRLASLSPAAKARVDEITPAAGGEAALLADRAAQVRRPTRTRSPRMPIR